MTRVLAIPVCAAQMDSVGPARLPLMRRPRIMATSRVIFSPRLPSSSLLHLTSMYTSLVCRHVYISPFHSFYTPTSIVAYAKGTVAYLAVLQELIFLGSTTGEQQTMASFANKSATWLQGRVDYLTNDRISLHTIVGASSFVEPVVVRCVDIWCVSTGVCVCAGRVFTCICGYQCTCI